MNTNAILVIAVLGGEMFGLWVFYSIAHHFYKIERLCGQTFMDYLLQEFTTALVMSSFFFIMFGLLFGSIVLWAIEG